MSCWRLDLLAAGGLVGVLGLGLALALVVAHGVHDEREEREKKKQRELVLSACSEIIIFLACCYMPSFMTGFYQVLIAL